MQRNFGGLQQSREEHHRVAAVIQWSVEWLPQSYHEQHRIAALVQLVSLHHCPHINCITTLLHAQRTVANFAACQHHRITIFHVLRVTALLHYCITASQGHRLLHYYVAANVYCVTALLH